MSQIGKIVKRSNSVFYWTCVYLFPKAQREAIYAVYAFCRHIDNIVDGDLPIAEKSALINAWIEELHNIYDNKVPATDVGRHIYKNCMRFKLPKQKFMDFILQTALDLPKPIQSMNIDEFKHYCRTIAGTQCFFAMKIMGFDDNEAEYLSDKLGIFLQITDILKDEKEDAKIDRIYAPNEFIYEAEIMPLSPEHIITDKNFSLVRAKLGALATQYYNETKDILEKTSRKKALPFKVLLNLYHHYFEEMEKRGWEIISPKPHLSSRQKVGIIIHTILK